MRPYYRNELLFSEIYLEDITRQKEQSDASLALRVLSEYREYANLSSLRAWKESFVHEVLAVLGFSYRAESESLTFLLPRGSAQSGSPISLCYVLPSNEDLNCTQLGRNWAEKTIRALREQHLNWGILTNGKTWRIYHVDEPTPYETYLEVDLESIITHQAVEAYQIFHKFMKVENFLIQSDGKCQFDRFKQESQNKIDYIEKELANALKQREEGGKGVLSDLCMGYVEALRQASQENLQDEAVRRKIYHSAMLYMFRLLFLFYADSRDLLSEDNHILLEKVLQTSQKAAEGDLQSSETHIWQMLETIFVDIDQTYNGGLFSPQESEFTRFLSEHRIQDFYLASAVLNLTHYREKNGQQKKINYRDMSVRHLGTLYEGLLEHKLFIAVEDTEVRVSKGKVQFIPVSKGGGLRKGQYIKAGKVYFASDLSERKLSGSYFTPEDVVDYIVRNTLGEKLKALKEAFWQQTRDTLRAYRSAVDEEERSALGQLFEEQALTFVRGQVLTLSVLDPAMGSGHFLVNAANLLANFITELLNEAGIEGTLETDTAYWRRWVVENCIFGVDLNPLAVELAKLSLWILSMARNQPLSFLNHHLKCGNSLVGARLEDIGNYPLSNAKKESRQLHLFERDPNFKAVVEEVIAKSRLIANRTSASLEDVREKKIWLEEIDSVLEGYKAICDLHTSLYFGNQVEESRYSAIIQNQEFDLARSLAPQKYFHWELEFPMVMLDLGGFDCVISNPPYVDVVNDYFTIAIYTTHKGRNLYNYFVEKALTLLNRSDGKLGFIIPISIITSERMKSTRLFIRQFKGITKFLNIDSSAHPGTLFDGLNLRLTVTLILLSDHEEKMRIHSSNFTKFFNSERNVFVPLIKTVEVPDDVIIDSIIPKIGSEIEVSILRKLLKIKTNYFSFEDLNGKNKLYYKGTGYNYMLAFKSPPFFEVNGKQVQNSKTKMLSLQDDILLEGAILVISSSLFYWFWTVYSNCFDFTSQDFARFPIDLRSLNSYKDELLTLYQEIEEDLKRNRELVSYNKASGITRYYQYRARFSKPLFDKIDDILAKIYDLTDEELSFVKNYDLRFRTDENDDA